MSLRIGIGPITAQRGPDDTRSWTEVYRDAVGLGSLAEEAGFDSVWVGEHHLTDDGYLPGVFPMLAALAARTERVVLGTKVVLAPLHHPLRIAEDAATVAVLSEGRLVLGMAVGYRREEFRAFGVDRRQRGTRLVQCVEICRAAWSGEPVTHAGDGIDIEARPVLPAPPRLPIWLGGRAAAALERAGALGDGFVAPASPTGDVVDMLATVDDAARGAGRPAPPLTTTVNVALGRVPPPAVDRGVEALLAGYRTLTASDNPTSRMASTEARTATVLEGEPDEVAERLAAHARTIGLDRDHHLVVRLDYPGMTGEDSRAHLDRFATEVLPRLRDLSRDT